MDNREFHTWLADFSARLPSKAAWLRNREAEVAGTPASVIVVWQEELGKVTLKSALESTKAVACDGNVENMWDLIPQVIRRKAERIQSNWDLQEARTRSMPEGESGQCVCHGGGLVDVYQTDQLEQYELTHRPPRVWMRLAVACTCNSGDKFATRSERGSSGERKLIEMPRYESSRFCLWSVEREDREAEVSEWLANRTAQPGGYSALMQSYNNS